MCQVYAVFLMLCVLCFQQYWLHCQAEDVGQTNGLLTKFRGKYLDAEIAGDEKRQTKLVVGIVPILQRINETGLRVTREFLSVSQIGCLGVIGINIIGMVALLRGKEEHQGGLASP